MRNRLIIFTILAVLTAGFILYFIKDKKVKNKTEKPTTSHTEKIKHKIINYNTASEYLQNDSLTKIYKYRIAKKYENGEPAFVFFYETDSTEPLYQKTFSQLGKLYIEGPIKDRKRFGRWYSWYEDGSLWSTGAYVDGKDDGLTMAYYENGTLRHSINYKDGQKEGLAKYYNDKGELVCEIIYSKNEIASRKDY